MKKILLMIALILCVFQTVVLATAIDVGNEAVEGTADFSGKCTVGSISNPANAAGKITSVEIYAKSGYNLTECEVAIFFAVDATHFSTRDYETLDNGNGTGVVVGGSKQTFTVDLDVEEGDYIGLYFLTGELWRITEAATGTFYMTAMDYVPCTNALFNVYTTFKISLYGTGATVEVGIKWNGVTITKWNGITITIPLNTQ